MPIHRPPEAWEPHCRRRWPFRRAEEEPVPWTRVAIVALLFLLLLEIALLGWKDPRYAKFFEQRLWRPLGHLLRWGLKFGVLFALWLFFFAQFLVPLKRVGDRLALTWRVLLNGVGWAGPVLLVQDGRILAQQGELLCAGPGVVVTDLASAMVLRLPAGYTQVIPPNSVGFIRCFLRWSSLKCDCEYVEDVVDLRNIARIVGPHPDENPFADRLPDEPEAHYHERRQRYYQTRGLTRDGIEVVPRIWVQFHLIDAPPRRRSVAECEEERLSRWFRSRFRSAAMQWPKFDTVFHGSADAVWRAVALRPVNTNAQGRGPVQGVGPGVEQYQRHPWDWLPAAMAAELWREYVRRFTLDELFTPLPQHGKRTGIEVIQHLIGERLSRPRFHEVDAQGRPHLHSPEVASPEFRRLQERGIRVEKVVFIGFHFPPEVERELAQLRANAWLQRARVARERVERQRARAQEQGERAALAALRQVFERQLGLFHLIQELVEHDPGVEVPPRVFPQVAEALLVELADWFDRADLRARLGSREVGRLRKLRALMRRYRAFIEDS